MRDIGERLGAVRRLGVFIDDPRAAKRIPQSLAGMLRFRLLMIAAGSEDRNDADSLRHHSVFEPSSFGKQHVAFRRS